MENKGKTLVLGASTNPGRYSYLAVSRLLENGFPVIPMGIKKGNIKGLKIENERPELDIDTLTLYLSPVNQINYYEYILSLHPKRVIFNPGTYNPELIEKLKAQNIEVIEACTLVMLSAGTY